MKRIFLAILLVLFVKTSLTLMAKPEGLIAQCKSNAATLTVPDGYFASQKGKCNPGDKTGNGYTLSGDCVSGQNPFIITNVPNPKVYDVKNLVGEFIVDCKNVKDGQNVDVHLSFTGPTPTPEPVYSAFVEMKLFLDKPTTSSNLSLTSLPTANFEDTLYLTIFNKAGKGELYPMDCKAEELKLYEVQKTSTSWTCSSLPDIIPKEGFQTIYGSGGNTEIAVASKMKVFEIPGKEGQQITITCSVKLCDASASGGECEKARGIQTPCNSLTSKRRRREAEMYDSSNLHHVSATFRVRNGPLWVDPDSSSGHTKYTFTTIIMAAVSTFLY